MPTYADLYNERLRALGQSGPSNLVRLTISKGDYVWDPQQDRFRYEEKWEEEQLMEAEELHDDDHLTASLHSVASDSRDSSPGPIAALQPTAVLTTFAAVAHSPSLWVLDTNTLMSCLELLKALFAALLTRNVASAAAAGSQQTHLAPSPIKLVIPFVVVSELDGLKLTRRKDDSGRQVASQARDANHWLLTAVQKQKRVPIDASGSNLPEQLWPLFLQTSSHYNRSKQSRSQGSRWTFDDPLSCDDQIVKYCAELKHQTHSSVFFCSDDINARTKAESESIDSLGMRELAHALRTGFAGVQSSERKWELVAEALIEQWEYQIGSAPAQPLPQHSQPAFAQEGQFNSSSAPSLQPGNIAHFADVESFEVDMDTEEPLLHSTEAHVYPGGAAMSTPPTASAPPRFSSLAHSPGRSTSDSIHSPHNKTRPERTMAARARQQDAAVPATSTREPAQADNSEALNPQISWEDLVQQLGSGSREAAKPRNTRR